VCLLACACVIQKRQLAAQSGLFNVKDPTFVELFPDIVKVSRDVSAPHSVATWVEQVDGAGIFWTDNC